MTSPNWKAQYAEIRPTYEVYEKKLRELVIEILEHAGIDVFQVEGRVKTLDSFDEKIKRKAGKYTAPLADMTDLVGLRIIAYYLEDVDRIVALLRDEFEVREEHSMNKQDELAPDQFGYASNHLVIRIGSRSERLEWAKYANVSVELQVRTMSQHAWAAVHHKLSYKRVEEVPTSLQRRLFRLSALFEMADEQFSAIRQAATELSDEYIDRVKVGNLGFEIDADSVDAYIRNSPKVARIVAELVAYGRSVDNGRRAELHRSDLVQVADHLGARTIEELDRLLPDDETTVRDILRVAGELGAFDDSADTVPETLSAVLLILHGASKEFFHSIYADGWDKLVLARSKLRSRQ
ncbi:MAG TPA: hypothetical protein VF821_13830 [Lentzea sp.]